MGFALSPRWGFSGRASIVLVLAAPAQRGRCAPSRPPRPQGMACDCLQPSPAPLPALVSDHTALLHRDEGFLLPFFSITGRTHLKCLDLKIVSHSTSAVSNSFKLLLVIHVSCLILLTNTLTFAMHYHQINLPKAQSNHYIPMP